MRKKLLITLLLASALAVFNACSGPAKNTQAAVLSEVSIREVAAEPDPKAAADKIYETLADRKVEQLTESQLMDLLEINSSDAVDFLAYRSDATAGLCDIIFLQPKDAMRDKLREALYQYKAKRVEEFKSYDILGSTQISNDAIVYDQGDYLILLMLPDDQAAQEIIDDYISQ